MIHTTKRLKAALEARFGDKQPQYGVLFKSPVIDGYKFDTYGRGNCHNSRWQYKQARAFNNPIPFPSDFRPILKALSVLHMGEVGIKSDPFMWMDMKYGVTKKLLKAANRMGVKLTFNTMSDLCAHDDYVKLLVAGGHTIRMDLGCLTEKAERQASPGAPSVLRRLTAVQKLLECGVNVLIVTHAVPADLKAA